jgi:RNA polymerase sigma-70 factor (ECF subfamily)
MLTATVLKKNGQSEEQRFDAFFQEHRQLVYRAAYSVTGSRQDAEDVLQTVFLNVLRHPEQTERARNIKGYLYRAAINEALYILRARERQRIVGDLECVEHVAGPAGSRFEVRIREDLRDAITKLKPEEVEIFLMRYEYGYSDADIARMLGYSRVKIAVTQYRARAQLKKLMRETASAVAPAGREQFGGHLSTGGQAR